METLTDQSKIDLVNHLIALSQQLAQNHNVVMSENTAWVMLRDIVENNYPKCAVKYVTGQHWRL